jgi:hypothetical protein
VAEPTVILFDFVRRQVRRITLREANERMREQKKSGVRYDATGSQPPPSGPKSDKEEA